MTTDMDKLAELRALAEKAATGNWRVRENCVYLDAWGGFSVHPDIPMANETAAFIAAANPQTVLSLLDRIEKQTKALDEIAHASGTHAEVAFFAVARARSALGDA